MDAPPATVVGRVRQQLAHYKFATVDVGERNHHRRLACAADAVAFAVAARWPDACPPRVTLLGACVAMEWLNLAVFVHCSGRHCVVRLHTATSEPRQMSMRELRTEIRSHWPPLICDHCADGLHDARDLVPSGDAFVRVLWRSWAPDVSDDDHAIGALAGCRVAPRSKQQPLASCAPEQRHLSPRAAQIHAAFR